MRIMVVGGSSGGHLFPAVALLDSLAGRCPGCRTLLAVPATKALIGGALRQYDLLTVSPLVFSASSARRALVAVTGLFRLSLQSLSAILSFKPDVVVGFGSAVSIPFLFWGWLFRRRTVIHEQNVIPGKANRLLAFFADRVCLSFAETAGYLPAARRKCRVTGNPLRKSLAPVEREQACSFFSFDPGLTTILVMGGSQGSVSLNQAVPEALAWSAGRSGLQVIHLAGTEKEAETVRQRYLKAGVRCWVKAFCDRMDCAYSAADLVVSRAGATTIAELIFFSRPAVLIPYPYAGGHQDYNARLLQDRGCARIVPDSQVKERLGGLLAQLLEDNGCRRRMAAAYAGQAGQPSDKLLTDEVMHG